MQLRFASFVVINLRRDLHPQECAHAGRTSKRDLRVPFICCFYCFSIPSSRKNSAHFKQSFLLYYVKLDKPKCGQT